MTSLLHPMRVTIRAAIIALLALGLHACVERTAPELLVGDAGPFALGALCSEVAPCPTGQRCIYPDPDGDGGYCSKTCLTPGEGCSGAPSGTYLGCAFGGDGTESLCAFFCRARDKNYSCPTELACKSQDVPPGSGQLICVAPPQ